ncbi:MAG: hypothetical protein MRERV_2c030 [Mycoplasmataceae bacterium RV_VA103A]|nr:MAG: hypothetical protein MRERV_2c030 [Mycoplasmataceae bacterium RV_VA103A]
MLKKIEWIVGHHGKNEPCSGCKEIYWREIANGRYDNKPQPAYLTIPNYKRDGLGERIEPEFYCLNCARAKYKELGMELIDFDILENGLAASMGRSGEWDYLWRQIEEEKKLRPSKEIWQKKQN